MFNFPLFAPCELTQAKITPRPLNEHLFLPSLHINSGIFSFNDSCNLSQNRFATVEAFAWLAILSSFRFKILHNLNPNRSFRWFYWRDFRLGLLADFLTGFAAGIGDVLTNRFIASSKLIPYNRRSMALGIKFTFFRQVFRTNYLLLGRDEIFGV